MILYYDNTDGKIFYAVYDADIFKFFHTTNIPLDTLEIDEVDPENKYLCADVRKTIRKEDAEGDSKYSVVNGEIYEKDNWEAKEEEE